VVLSTCILIGGGTTQQKPAGCWTSSRYSTGSGEAFYRDASVPSTEEADAGRPPDLDPLRAAAKHHPDTIEILGPPPFEAAREEGRRKSQSLRACRKPPAFHPPGWLLTTYPRARRWPIARPELLDDGLSVGIGQVEHTDARSLKSCGCACAIVLS